MSDEDNFKLLARLIRKLYRITDALNEKFSSTGRRFTLDGHLLGSIGEVIAAFVFDLVLEPPSREGHDARTKDGKKVQIKLTGVNSGISLNSKPDFLIALRLTDSEVEILYNGPGVVVFNNCGRKQKNGQRRIALSTLRRLNRVSTERIPIVRPLPKILRRKPDLSLR